MRRQVGGGGAQQRRQYNNIWATDSGGAGGGGSRDRRQMGNCFQAQTQAAGSAKQQTAASGAGAATAAAAAAAPAPATAAATGAAAAVPERPEFRRKMSALSNEALTQLDTYDSKIAAIQTQVTAFRARCAAPGAGRDELVGIKNRLAGLNGQLDKLQFQGIDSVVTGPLTSGKAQARAQRKGLNKTAAALSKDIKALHAVLAQALAARQQQDIAQK